MSESYNNLGVYRSWHEYYQCQRELKNNFEKNQELIRNIKKEELQKWEENQ